MKAEPPTRSIRRQLTVTIVAGTLILLFVAGSILLGVIHRRLVRDFDRILDAEAAMLIRNAERKAGILFWDVPDTYSAGSRGTAEPAYCQLFLKDGTVVGLSQTLGTDDLPRLDARGSAEWDARLPDGRRGRLVQRRFYPKVGELDMQVLPDDPQEQSFEIPSGMDPASVELVLVVARSREPLDSLLGSLYLAVAGVAVTLALALAWLVRRAITRALLPIEDINAQISAIAPDSLDKRLHISAPPVELAAIEATVNRLLNRVEQAFERERRFSNDLAHELRTPIAELRTACEVGERWPDDPESTRQFFHDTREIALHLEKIVGALLTLSRSEGGNSMLQTRRIELQDFVRGCWQRAMVPEKPLQFQESIAPDLAVDCDEDILGIILRNLMENAISHSETNTVVECAAVASPDGVELRLTNTAKDLGREDVEHVFERFWRKDESRTDRRHIGLGLSIAKAMCEMLGLRLRVDLIEGGRFEVKILFPTVTRP
jgi:signal transduction histidine kinase